MQVLLGAVLVDALHAPLEDRDHTLDGVGVDIAPDVLAGRVTHGLVLGDVIQGIDGVEIEDLGDLSEVLDDKQVGQEVVLDVWRGGKERQVTLKLGSPDR